MDVDVEILDLFHSFFVGCAGLTQYGYVFHFQVEGITDIDIFGLGMHLNSYSYLSQTIKSYIQWNEFKYDTGVGSGSGGALFGVLVHSVYQG